jgi:pimeloyl-ACP methyl ester carboxylesterase
MPIIERQGARIHYDVSGDGPPIILGHSLLCDGRMWEHVAPDLARKHRVINVDARGHGGSTAPGPFTLEDLADDWIAILNREGISKATLCGLSMGGMTAMRLALAAPDRVKSLILVDTSADAEQARKRLQYIAMAELVRRFGFIAPIHWEIKRLMFGRTTQKERPALAEQWARRFHENDTHQVYHAVRAVAERGSLEGRLQSIHRPTLVLVGAEDRATPPERSERIGAAIPGVKLRYIPAAGHLSALEAPGPVLHEIEEFLGGLD